MTSRLALGTLFALLLGLLLPGCTAHAGAKPAADAPPSPLARMAWLTGCWQLDGRERGSQEHWLAPAGGAMLGLGRTVARGRTVAFEFMQLRVDAQGRLVFIAQPDGKPATTFVQSESADAATTSFENPRTDFPQRVSYRRIDPDRLLAWIDGQRDGKTAKVEFPMTRVTCDTAAAQR
jgi:Domain of unknown function (DUF6265)